MCVTHGACENREAGRQRGQRGQHRLLLFLSVHFFFVGGFRSYLHKILVMRFVSIWVAERFSYDFFFCDLHEL